MINISLVDTIAQELFLSAIASAPEEHPISSEDVRVMARLAFQRAHQFAIVREEYHAAQDRITRRRF